MPDYLSILLFCSLDVPARDFLCGIPINWGVTLILKERLIYTAENKNVAALDGGGSGDVNPRKPTGVSSAASVNKIVSQNEGIINLSA